ncbi:lysosomal amino acid transporter 1 homolog [Cajanus cajan]|uniref:Membrane protein YOL092W family n=1 Tax=Cajanus cajan TaxID=3821 RepID=A0A151RJ94_CAJCA|nr:lysosomal amino acid transporter 1 homolog [Cajanus cajan]KYP42650.1 putative membrane protein YOL092W family [Cajanus cajan]
MQSSYCVKEAKPCVRWVEKYFKDCLCNLKDDISFGFGLTSLVFWGVAEIPQIITIFHTKKSHGVSIIFLLTWVAGDICNLTGCILEPATLPTQYYTALLYTITTIVLLLQIVYYDYICRWYKHRQKVINNQRDPEEEKKPLKPPKPSNKSAIPIPNGTPKASPRPEYYYMSARSLAGSGTPPWGTYLRAAKSGPSAMALIDDSSSEDESSPIPSNYSPTQAMPIPRPIAGSYGTFLAAAVNLPLRGNALREGYLGRKLLQEYETHSAFGQWLGWLMAAIYISGRVPQIWLNIKRGSVEGLNPFMFLFALMANVTYVGSILVRTTKWESIKANMPWLLDAVFCVALDFFIILQFIFYRYFQRRQANDDYEEAGKAAAS